MLVTTDYVVDETLTLMRSKLGLDTTRKWWDQFGASPRVLIELIDGSRAEKARSIFFGHRDKDYSFTDCTSFVIMKEFRIQQALTTDKRFRKMGFEMLPRPKRK